MGKVESMLKVGQFVSYGTFIGTSGVSGNAGTKNGELQKDVIPHVHVRARKNGKPYDPELLMKRKYNMQTGEPTPDPNNDPCK